MHPLGSLCAWHPVCVCCPLSVLSPGDRGLGDLSLPAHMGMHHGAVAGWAWGWERVKPHLGDLGTNPRLDPGYGAWNRDCSIENTALERVKPHLGDPGCQSQAGSRIWSPAEGLLCRKESPGMG